MKPHAPPPDSAATAERWARIDELFHAALDRPAHERHAFLSSACGDDHSLLAEVESLLGADGSLGQRSLEAWVQAAAAARVDENVQEVSRQSGSLAGRSVLQYDVHGQIGAGGMGDVYLATDRTLGRHVAIKTLPRAVAGDERRLQRFRREARAASALSHPNVAAIYQLGEADGQPFIAMEYVEGRTLDAMLRSEGPMPLRRAIDVVLQVSGALGEAHDAGITHRDIKPGNVMISSRGLVKVLDFGLAKLVSESADIGDAAEAGSAPREVTLAGALMGTIDYMSPEQALAQPTDHRSDLFSLGVLIYQLTTGVLPFRRSGPSATIAAILHADPLPPSQVRRGLPQELDRIVERALAKAPHDRYPSARELSSDLEALRRQLDGPGDTARPASPRRPRPLLYITVVVMSAAASIAVWRVSSGPDAAPLVVPFTSLPGIESTPAFSPDGERIAFAWDGPDRDNVDVYVQVVPGGAPVRLTTDPAQDNYPAFSPDGALIAFVRGGSRVLIVPAEGGEEREVGPVADPRITFTQDGQFIAAGGPASPGAHGAGIVLLPIAGGPTRPLTRPPPGTIDIAPAFSPDGSRLAFQRIPTPSVSDIWVADATGVNARRITFDNTMLTGPVWAQDGRSLIFGSARLGAGRLWRVAASGGVPQPLPDTGPGATMPTVPRRGDRIAFVASFQDTNIWELRVAADGAAVGPPRPIASGSSWLDGSPDFSRDGRLLVFASNRTGRDEIFLSEVDGLTPRQLTDFSGVAGSTVGSPRLSPDATQVVFDARVLGNADIYVASIAGGPLRRLTTDSGADFVPVWSPDGAWVYFTSLRTGRPEIWRIPSAGGVDERITDDGAFGAQFSPDGRYLIYGKERAGTSLWRRPVDGGPEEPALLDERGQPRVVVQFAFWRPIPGGIVFVERRVVDGERQPRFVVQSWDEATRRVTPVVTLSAPPALAAGGLAVSPDGRRLLYTQVDALGGDINLLQPYR
jgi:eukaryotic-like serine/threonine-protein kinase